MSWSSRLPNYYLSSEVLLADSCLGWVTERHTSPHSESDIWTNKDSDVTPLEQRTWTTWTMLGFWISDSLSAQGWEGAASIIAVGLTW